MGRKLLHLLNGLITCAVVVALVLAGAYAGYALWDNQQIYDAAENSLSEMKEIRSALGMPTTVSALTELLEENRAARKAKAEATETPAPELTTAPTEAAPSVTDTIPTVANETAGTEVLVQNTAATAAPETSTSVPETSTPVPVTVTPVPTEEPVDDSLFGQLKAINKDITAWITLPNTAIDYPVMQGKTNYSYINKDVYGNFALAGSIFLDSRNNSDYSDLYNLLYGHNMSHHKMFGDINLYKDKDFFKENTLGILILPDGNHIIESLSVIVTPASDSGLMNPENWNHLEGEEIYHMVQENALFTCEEGLEALQEKLDAGETPRLLSLSTCSDEFTDARTILLTLMDP